MSRTYKITGFNWLDRTQLKPHADAQLPMAPDDQMALERSIEEGGLIQPLLVLDKPDKLDGLFEVVDGCNRLDKSTDGKLPCVLIQCDNVREVALTCLGTGRKRSTGQRIMAYLEMHKREVVKATELCSVAAGGNSFGVSRDTPKLSGVFANFTSDAIAATLSVSKKDVLLAIDLLMCLEKKCTVPQRVGSLVTPTRELDLKDKADKVYFDCLKLTHANVMAGSTPILQPFRSNDHDRADPAAVLRDRSAAPAGIPLAVCLGTAADRHAVVGADTAGRLDRHLHGNRLLVVARRRRLVGME